MTINVTYTNEEAQAAIQLYDLAVKFQGMVVAEAALLLTKKLQEAPIAKQEETVNENQS